MARLIKSTKEKIERLNTLVNKGIDYAEIVKQEWQGSHKAKDKWVQKFKEHLSDKVLTALKYTNEEATEEKQEQKQEDNINPIMSFLGDADNFKALQEIIEKYKKNENVAILDIPAEYMTDTTAVRSIRMSETIYDEFVNLCKQYNLTIGACVNYAFAQFIKRYKK